MQLYQDTAVLCDAVAHYLAEGLRKGDAVIVIARPEHRLQFKAALGRSLDVREALATGQLTALDAEETLNVLMRQGSPEAEGFDRAVGRPIAALRALFPAVRAYGEMVDLLWQRGERDAAIRLEEMWNGLAARQSFSLFCAYRMSATDPQAYGGGLESVCRVHSHVLPALDCGRFDQAVHAASIEVLGEKLARQVAELSARRSRATQMPAGQAALFWLREHMPLAAERVLDALQAKQAA